MSGIVTVAELEQRRRVAEQRKDSDACEFVMNVITRKNDRLERFHPFADKQNVDWIDRNRVALTDAGYRVSTVNESAEKRWVNVEW